MAFDTSAPALQLRSLLKDSGELELALVEVPVPEPGPDEGPICVEGAPIKPSDRGLLFAGLVNVVRSAPQEQLLREQGAEHVCNPAAPTFMPDLSAAIASTGATPCFDAIGGGPLVGQILGCMEGVLARQASGCQICGSTTHPQACICGSLDPGPRGLLWRASSDGSNRLAFVGFAVGFVEP